MVSCNNYTLINSYYLTIVLLILKQRFLISVFYKLPEWKDFGILNWKKNYEFEVFLEKNETIKQDK